MSAASALAGLCVSAVLPASAAAITDTITAVASNAYEGASGPGGEFLLDAGSVPAFVNSEAGVSHNVVAVAGGPDGEELFQTPLIDGGQSIDVAGTQYLGPGTYDFVCTIHVGMDGRLLVSGAGAFPRPSVEVSIRSSKLAQVRRGSLKVLVEATTPSADVDIEARLGARSLARASGVDFEAGQGKNLVLKLGSRARKLLKGPDRARVKVTATVPFGAPDSAKRTLK